VASGYGFLELLTGAISIIFFLNLERLAN